MIINFNAINFNLFTVFKDNFIDFVHFTVVLGGFSASLKILKFKMAWIRRRFAITIKQKKYKNNFAKP